MPRGHYTRIALTDLPTERIMSGQKWRKYARACWAARRTWMSVHKFVKVGILLLNDSWFRLFCNSYMFGVVICHICAFISNRTRTFEWMIVSFLNYIWNYLKFIWLFLKLIWTTWNPFGYFWNWFELFEIHLEFSEFDLNYLKFICTFLNSTWTISEIHLDFSEFDLKKV